MYVVIREEKERQEKMLEHIKSKKERREKRPKKNIRKGRFYFFDCYIFTPCKIRGYFLNKALIMGLVWQVFLSFMVSSMIQAEKNTLLL